MTLAPPPRDETGKVEPHDHSGINDGDGVIRRISPQHVVYDEKIAGNRISSAAFRASSGQKAGMSVDLQKLIEDSGLDARKYVTSPRWIGSVRFDAGVLRGQELQVGFDPLVDNPYHGQVWGNFSKSKPRKLQQLCDWFVKLEDVSLF